MGTAIRTTLVAAFLMAAATGCGGDGELTGDGDIVTETRTVDNFTTVQVDNGARLVLGVGASSGVDTVDLAVTTDSNLLESVTTEVSGDRLTVSIDRNIDSTRGTEITGTIAALSNVSVDDGGQATITASLTEIGLSADNGGWIRGRSLEVGNATIDADNGAKIDICVTDDLTGTVTNGAVLTVSCGADTSSIQTSNGGRVTSD